VTIEIDPEEPEYVSEGWSRGGAGDGAHDRRDAMGAAAAAMAGGGSGGDRDGVERTGEELATADVKQMMMRMPEQLRHTAVEVPVKVR